MKHLLLLAVVIVAFQAIATSAIDTILFKQHGSIQYSDGALSNDIIEQLKIDMSLSDSEQQQSHRGHITVDNNIVQRIKEYAAGSAIDIDDIIDGSTGGVKLQTRFINQSTQPHVDRYHHNGEVVDDDVMFVALDSNPDAHFTHGDSSIPAVAGRLFRFNGSIKHGTTFNGGNPIRLLGPFSTKNFASVGDLVPSFKVFVTSKEYTGDLGGISGADAKCQELACSAGLVGNFKAWLSDQTSNPANDFVQSASRYRVVINEAVPSTIALDFADLIDGTVQNPINRDENGALISGNLNVWTNTNADGTRVSNDRGCENWSSALGGSIGQVGGQLGDASAINSEWTRAGPDTTQTCNSQARLYCFQQDDLGTYFIVFQVVYVYVYTNKFLFVQLSTAQHSIQHLALR